MSLTSTTGEPVPRPVTRIHQERPGDPVSVDQAAALLAELDELLVSIRRQLDAVFVAQGLSRHEYDALIHLAVSDRHALPLTRLAHDIGLTSGAGTKCVDRLEGEGYVRRASSRTDRRIIYAVLTREGYEASQRLRLMYRREIERRVLPALRDDGVGAARTLCRVLRNLDGVDSVSSPPSSPPGRSPSK